MVTLRVWVTRLPAGEWVLLSYRLPREPSTPRITLWRKLKKLGVAQLADGVVALPADARTREQFDWLAEEVVESGGQAGVWLARPSTARQERELAAQMADARAVGVFGTGICCSGRCGAERIGPCGCVSATSWAVATDHTPRLLSATRAGACTCRLACAGGRKRRDAEDDAEEVSP